MNIVHFYGIYIYLDRAISNHPKFYRTIDNYFQQISNNNRISENSSKIFPFCSGFCWFYSIFYMNSYREYTQYDVRL